jgi:hypothetical protein
VLVQPHPGNLAFCGATVPTPRGPIGVEWERGGNAFTLALSLPPGLVASVQLPASGAARVSVDGQEARGIRSGRWLHVAGDWCGNRRFVVG